MIDRYLQRHVKLIHTGNVGPFSASSAVVAGLFPMDPTQELTTELILTKKNK